MNGRPSRCRPALAATLLVALASGTVRGQVASTVSDRLDVRLVEVDAWAEADGRAVRDLRADELRLSEDGRRVEILFFTPPERAESTPAAAGAAGEPAAGDAPPVPNWRSAEATRDTLAIFFDDAHMAPANRARVVASLVDWFERRESAGADFTVARYERGLEVVLPRTAEAARVAPVLRALAPAGMRAVEESLDERRTLDTIRQIQRRGIEDMQISPGGGSRAGDEAAEEEQEFTVGVPCSSDMLRQADDWADRTQRSSEETLQVLGAYAASLAALPGRKILLFVSDGIASRPGGPAYDLIRTLCDGSGAQQGIPDAIDVTALPRNLVRQGQLDRATLAFAGDNRQLANRFSEVVAQANSSGVTVWTYSARGLTAAGDDASLGSRERTAADQSRQRVELEALMSTLAIDTGGRALLEVGDLGSALDQLDRDLAASYLLAFAVPRAADGKLHKIKLETTRKGVRLRYRQSWRDTTGEEDLVALVHGALLHGVDRPGLGANAALGRSADGPQAGRPRLRIVVPEAAMTLLPHEDGSRHGVLRIALAMQSPGASASPVRSRTFEIALPALADAGGAKPIVRDIDLPELPAGTVVAVGLRDEVDGESGVVRLEVAPPVGGG
ncbi:MAG: VWA domain-containing protein [Thermoanaerobaculia bacterium]|nr:VWA domain-containing protein [Thermoanaerobaculia bacterium]